MHWFPGFAPDVHTAIGILQEMDVRESAYWKRRARIEEIEETLRMAHAMRMAQATDGGYKTAAYKLTQELSILNLHITQKELWARNWENIKKVIPKRKKK